MSRWASFQNPKHDWWCYTPSFPVFKIRWLRLLGSSMDEFHILVYTGLGRMNFIICLHQLSKSDSVDFHSFVKSVNTYRRYTTQLHPNHSKNKKMLLKLKWKCYLESVNLNNREKERKWSKADPNRWTRLLKKKKKEERNKILEEHL